MSSFFQIKKNLDNISRSFLPVSSTIPITGCYQNCKMPVLSAIDFNVRKKVCIGGKHITPTYLTDKSRFIFVRFLGFLRVIVAIESLVCTVSQLCYKGNVNITYSPRKSRFHNELSVVNMQFNRPAMISVVSFTGKDEGWWREIVLSELTG